MESPKGPLNVIRHIGPGIILSGSVIGSGALLVTTRMGAQFGYIFLWGVILCCVIKYFGQVELGRYCISNNLTSIQAFNRFPFAKIRKTSVLNIFFFAILAMITPGLAGTFGSCAGLLYSLFPTIPAGLWGVILFASVTAFLWRGHYKDLEKIIMVLVGGFSLSILICFFLMQGTTYNITGPALLSGINFKVPKGGMLVAMALMGSVGVNAAELFFYPYLLKEKGYGERVGTRPGGRTEAWLSKAIKAAETIALQIIPINPSQSIGKEKTKTPNFKQLSDEWLEDGSGRWVPGQGRQGLEEALIGGKTHISAYKEKRPR